MDDAVEDGAEKLTPSNMRDILSGSTVKAKGYGQEAEIIFHQNHKLSATNTSDEKDTGNWKINDDEMLCLRFYHWGEKQTICYLVYQDDEELLLFNKKGMQMYEFTITEKGETNFDEGINYASSPSNQNKSKIAGTDHPPLPDAPRYNFTKKTAEDVQFFVRQTAQNCPGCNLAKADLSGKVLLGANLQGANLTEANLSDAVLRRANLKGANLYKANLNNTNLMGADLTGANLTDADLTDAHLQGAIGVNQ